MTTTQTTPRPIELRHRAFCADATRAFPSSIKDEVVAAGGIRVLVLDPPSDDAGDTTAATVLANLQPLLRADAVVMVYLNAQRGAAMRAVVENVLGRDCFRAEVIVAPDATTQYPQAALQPMQLDFQVIALYTAEPSYALPRPGKWDTIVAGEGGSTHSPAASANPAAEPASSGSGWSRDRLLQAVRNFKEFENTTGGRVSFDHYYAELTRSGAGPTDFLRLRDGEILLYIPADQNDTLSTVWFDLPPSAAPGRSPAPVERVLEWFSDPVDVVFDPSLGTGGTATAARRTGRTLVGVDTSPHNVARALATLEDSTTPKEDN